MFTREIWDASEKIHTLQHILFVCVCVWVDEGFDTTFDLEERGEGGGERDIVMSTLHAAVRGKQRNN